MEKKVSKKNAKKYFSSLGLFLIIYTLVAVLAPPIVTAYLEMVDPRLLKNEYLVYGIRLLILALGTFIPFFMMQKFSKVRFKNFLHNIDASFSDIFVQSVICFTICIFVTYISNIIFSYFGIGNKLLTSIGLSFEDANLQNILYVANLIVFTPIIEEYAFRGVLLYCLGRYGKYFALYASAIIFAFAHGNFAEMLPAFVMGLLLNKIALRYRSIKPTIIVHIFFNLAIYFMCIMSMQFSKYIVYVLALILAIAVYFIVTGKYQIMRVLNSKQSKRLFFMFFSRMTVVIAIAFMIFYSIAYVFFRL